MIIAGKYDAKTLVKLILRGYPEIRHSTEYTNMLDMIMDFTMSCNKDEQMGQLRCFMTEAIHQDRFAEMLRGNKSLQQFRYETAVQFIAAYDLM